MHTNCTLSAHRIALPYTRCRAVLLTLLFGMIADFRLLELMISNQDQICLREQPNRRTHRLAAVRKLSPTTLLSLCVLLHGTEWGAKYFKIHFFQPATCAAGRSLSASVQIRASSYHKDEQGAPCWYHRSHSTRAAATTDVRGQCSKPVKARPERPEFMCKQLQRLRWTFGVIPRSLSQRPEEPNGKGTRLMT